MRLWCQGMGNGRYDVTAAPVVAISNLNRQIEDRQDRRPRLTDLRNCGEIEDIADLVLFTHRPRVDLERDEPHEGTPEHLTWQENLDAVWDRAVLFLAKNRHGSNTTMHFKIDLETMCVSDYSWKV